MGGGGGEGGGGGGGVPAGPVVPPKVLALVKEFWVCLDARCRKVFWRGPKYASARDEFSARFAGGVGGGM